jgi:hypothetical protein
MNELTTYLEKFGLLSLEKQDKLDNVIGDYLFELDLENGKVRFNELEFSCQVLGTESDNTITWLWAWADEQTEVPLDLITASRELKDWGKRLGVEEFTVPAMDLSKADGRAFSLIASELCKANAYYRDAYEGGSLFVLLFDARIDNQPSFDLTRLSRQLLDFISYYELNHRNVLFSYLQAKGLSPIEYGSRMVCKLETGELLSAEFDALGRLVLLNEDSVVI